MNQADLAIAQFLVRLDARERPEMTDYMRGLVDELAQHADGDAGDRNEMIVPLGPPTTICDHRRRNCECMRIGARRGDENGPRAVTVPCTPDEARAARATRTDGEESTMTTTTKQITHLDYQDGYRELVALEARFDATRSEVTRARTPADADRLRAEQADLEREIDAKRKRLSDIHRALTATRGRKGARVVEKNESVQVEGDDDDRDGDEDDAERSKRMDAATGGEELDDMVAAARAKRDAAMKNAWRGGGNGGDAA